VLRGEARGWKIDDGKIVNIGEINDAAQTKEEFTDGEVRIRFEVMEVSRLWFNLRQGTGGYSVNIESDIKALEGKPHDIVYRAKGDQVTATLDGKPIPVVPVGPSTSGCLQFNGFGKRFAVVSIDFRPLTP